jgi:hypothetical protein
MTEPNIAKAPSPSIIINTCTPTGAFCGPSPSTAWRPAESQVRSMDWSSSDEAKKMEELSIFGLPNDYLITERRAMAL